MMTRKIGLYLLPMILFFSMGAYAIDPGVKCVTITLHNKGGYVLDYEFKQSNPVCGPEKSGSLDAPQKKGPFSVSKGSFLRCHAHSGKTKIVTLTKSGTIVSTGTTEIGFDCKYKD